ncbi:uncharacterized protein BDR25DRAFT_355368 [Lindgomyces ingoldianus]|uniref:Uncharacterized protein n=1 Tax=Lindgomyces ingoldianus TaxID=673940 RepID=A0ACB6QUK8_9PLEO|nr:uncharacterized protein BDR25DRAFT_355368 [Lindgomyces ingoldianus]KAF2470258.1 hypothetical protein BDR25DRAFT_355368 [Lindgomyces ingoldianus]
MSFFCYGLTTCGVVWIAVVYVLVAKSTFALCALTVLTSLLLCYLVVAYMTSLALPASLLLALSLTFVVLLPVHTLSCPESTGRLLFFFLSISALLLTMLKVCLARKSRCVLDISSRRCLECTAKNCDLNRRSKDYDEAVAAADHRLRTLPVVKLLTPVRPLRQLFLAQRWVAYQKLYVLERNEDAAIEELNVLTLFLQ